MSELTDEVLQAIADPDYGATMLGTEMATELIALRAERAKLVAQHAEDKRLWTADMRALKEAAQPAESGATK